MDELDILAKENVFIHPAVKKTELQKLSPAVTMKKSTSNPKANQAQNLLTSPAKNTLQSSAKNTLKSPAKNHLASVAKSPIVSQTQKNDSKLSKSAKK
jgi:hypothetical protein